MNLRLVRTEFKESGIFGQLLDDTGKLVAVTLEHSYQNDDGTLSPKIPNGTFTCIRGPHRLHGMTEDFETFEVTGVEGHSNLLFHWGNYNRDSEGCILVGKEIVSDMITHSRETFETLMSLQEGRPSFNLTVS